MTARDGNRFVRRFEEPEGSGAFTRHREVWPWSWPLPPLLEGRGGTYEILRSRAQGAPFVTRRARGARCLCVCERACLSIVIEASNAAGLRIYKVNPRAREALK